MEYPKTRAPVEGCFLEESYTLQACKRDLLRDLKQSVTACVRRRQIVTRQHLFKDLAHALYT